MPLPAQSLHIKPLTHTPFENIFEAFSRAFADYEMQLDGGELRSMLRRRGFDPALSFAAFDGERIVAFTLNGTGVFNGLPTAYDTGTGTVKKYRGQGLATKIFEYSLPYLRENGIRQYLLEVLQHNSAAVSVYSKLGFEVTREFYYFRQDAAKVFAAPVRCDTPCVTENFDPADLGSQPCFGDFEPSWQNSIKSILRTADDFIFLGACHNGSLIGYCVFEPSAGDLPQLAVDPRYRRQGVASMLLHKALSLNRCGIVKVINTDISCGCVTAFLQSKNIHPSGKQFEMIKRL